MDRRGARDGEKRGSTGRDVLGEAPHPRFTRVLVDHEAPHPLAFTHLWAVIRLLPLAGTPSPNLLNGSVSWAWGLGLGVGGRPKCVRPNMRSSLDKCSDMCLMT